MTRSSDASGSAPCDSRRAGPPPERLGTDGQQTRALDQPRHRLLLVGLEGPGAAHSALHRLQYPAGSTAADVRQVPVTRLGLRGVVRARNGLQLRDAAVPAAALPPISV